MMRVRERRPEQRIQAQVTAQKEEKLGLVKQGWKASRRGAKERTKRSGMRRRPCLSSLRNERQGAQKKRPYGRWRFRSLNNSRFTCAICLSTFCIYAEAHRLSSTSFFISLGTGIWRTWRLPRLTERIQIGPWPLPFSQKRQPGLLQRTMRLHKEPGKTVERSGICWRSCLREAVSWATLSFISIE